jgi:hypothetical protein
MSLEQAGDAASRAGHGYQFWTAAVGTIRSRKPAAMSDAALVVKKA